MALETLITATGNALAVTTTSWMNVIAESAALGFDVLVAVTKVFSGT
ncbi:MAG: hypothetical protein MASP_00363 [Candidatus Methanolliviera sp. GoM_asphalt]|nr:MAG: hypothetical protein MASP_00363 [Candidatus Methanolliviera sp. GoM_asphalt]